MMFGNHSTPLKEIVIFLFLYAEIVLLMFIAGTTRLYVNHLHGDENTNDAAYRCIVP